MAYKRGAPRRLQVDFGTGGYWTLAVALVFWPPSLHISVGRWYVAIAYA